MPLKIACEPFILPSSLFRSASPTIALPFDRPPLPAKPSLSPISSPPLGRSPLSPISSLRSPPSTLLRSESPKPITSPVPDEWYPTLAVVMLSLGLLFTAFFFMAVAQYLKSHSPEDLSSDLSLNKILEGKRRKLCARMFFETLKTKRAPKVEVGTTSTDANMDEWLQGTAYTQSLNNKSKKKK